MYKKKLGVRVITAITVGSLLCSNASMAMASPDVSSIIEDYEEKEEQESEAEKLEETEAVEETEAETEAVEETEAETEAEEETEAETEAVEETEAETEAEEETEAETEAEEETEAETEAVEETEIETEAVSKFTEAEETETQVEAANSKDVTVQITYYDSSITTGNNQIGTGYEHVTVTEGEEPIVLKASELDNITIDGVEYQVSAEAMDLTVEYRENVNEYRWAVAMEKVPVANSKDVTVQITYYDPSITTGNNQIGTGYEHVTVTEGEEPIVLKASELDNITVDGVEYQVSAEAVDLTVEYRENVNEYRWAVAMEKVPVANSKDVTVQITYYDPSITTGNNQIGTGYEHVTVTEGEEPIVLKASELDNITVDGVEYQVSAEAVDLTVEYRENVNEYRWAVAMEKVTVANSKDVTVQITYYDPSITTGNNQIGTGYEHVTVTEGEEPIVLKASELDNITVDGVEYQVSAEAMDLTDVEYP